ncbi:MAG: hypothetical protein JW981_00575 [Anaerolineae bacterium]|nr:hypothetical protein [Anaerolineae bacterium]
MNPILIRHLHSSVKKNTFFWLISLYLLGIGLLLIFFYSIIVGNSIFSLDGMLSLNDLFTAGRVLYWFSAAVLLITAWLLAPISALGSISSERERRTLDILRTTTLPVHSLVMGKMGNALITGALYILAPLPMLLAGYWLGGVTIIELVITFLVILTALLVNIAKAIFLSSRLKRTLTSVLVYYGMALVTTILIGIGLISLASFADSWQYKDHAAVPLWVEAMIQYGWTILIILHPITTGIFSEALWVEYNSLGLIELPLEISATSGFSGIAHTITLPSPWIVYTALALLVAFLLTRATIRHLKRPEP